MASVADILFIVLVCAVILGAIYLSQRFTKR